MTKGEKIFQTLTAFLATGFIIIFFIYFFRDTDKETVVKTFANTVVEESSTVKEESTVEEKQEETAIEDLTDYSKRYYEDINITSGDTALIYDTGKHKQKAQLPVTRIVPYFVKTGNTFNLNDLTVTVKLEKEVKTLEGYNNHGVGFYVYNVRVKNKTYKSQSVNGYTLIHKLDEHGFRNSPSYSPKHKLNYTIGGGKTVSFKVVFPKFSEKDTWKNIVVGVEDSGLLMQWSDNSEYTGDARLDYVIVDRTLNKSVTSKDITYHEQQGVLVVDVVTPEKRKKVELVPIKEVSSVINDVEQIRTKNSN